MGEALYIRPMPDTAACEVHDWTVEDFRLRFVDMLRARHGKGGLTVCTPCIERAREHLKPNLKGDRPHGR